MERALKRRYGKEIVLEPLSDVQERRTNRNIVERFTSPGSRR